MEYLEVRLFYSNYFKILDFYLFYLQTLPIDRGEAEVNSQGGGDNKLAIPEYTVYEYFIIPKNITLMLKSTFSKESNSYE
jgi:hypothetical protein